MGLAPIGYRAAAAKRCSCCSISRLAGVGVMDELGPSLGTIDFDTLSLGADGAFDLLLSGERPGDWRGDWREA